VNNYQELFRKKYVEEQERIYKELFKEDYIEGLKLPKDYTKYLDVGVDRIGLDIAYKDLEGSARKLKEIRIKGEKYDYFKIGKFRGIFYCKLYINLPKNLYGNNIRNVRNKKLINKAVTAAITELKESGFIIGLKSTFEYIEINKYVILDDPIFKLDQPFRIIRKYITRGNFSREDKNHNKSRNKTGASFGTTNKLITFYSKILELLKKNENLEKITMSELRKIASKFKEFMRMEIKLQGKSITSTLSKKLTLEEFLEDPEKKIDEIYTKIIKESGLNEIDLENSLKKSTKRLTTALKRYKRVYDRLFIKEFVKDYSSEIWGNEQLEMIADESTDNRRDKYVRKNSLISNFKTVKTNEIDCLNCIKKVVKDLNLF